ncbi:molybdopterin-dependent oxidoreductase [Celeribacter litoreus]|uniref:molybdopterin-dependent oxidoreductase n=1 Tax=Celeribacter litoreus TaxID=2876714 RepID=UPI001CCC8298|nr:molybdopterin-dependent oxidoreductase [Celeribacter litoreus]MCA0044217.1 molybdopterin-dependent oxidoreductase [Celeribacter litoreus]
MFPPRIFRLAVCALVALTLSPVTASADMLEAPTGEVILTVSGEIGASNIGDTAQFDLAMLQAMPAMEITTETIWTPSTHVFTGVPLRDFLDQIGVEGSMLEAQAINDYTVEIPVSDATPQGPIIAYSMDGAPMSRRDKGPLWIIYPYSSGPEYQTELIYTRSIWQLDRLTVVE